MKMYSAFISSVGSMQRERMAAKQCLLSHWTFPICMEHFRTDSRRNFTELKEYIDNSDFFVILIGSEYGSCDEFGVSWTEREYQYANDIEKPILAIKCSDEQKMEEKQKEFFKGINFAVNAYSEIDISEAISSFFAGPNSERFDGWIRNAMTMNIERWQEENKRYNIGGSWYHIHLSNDDESYIRIGTVEIKQNFKPNEYLKLRLSGINYNVKHTEEDGKIKIVEETMKRTKWDGEYTMNLEGQIVGLFNARRDFSSKFGENKVDRGIRRGIHDFNINERIDEFESFVGEFHDEAPSPKTGCIYMFRNKEDRNKYLMEYLKGLNI